MAGLSYHTSIDGTFPDAPFPASGPPDNGIAFVYPDMSYFEWTQQGDTRAALNKVLDLLSSGDFHGILGKFDLY